MIARCRAKCWIVQLKEMNEDVILPSTQRGVKGHIIIYPQRPSTIAKSLPPSIDEICTPICVIFVGSSPPSREWLQQKAKPLSVRREKVREALLWLKKHNQLYKDIEIDHVMLDTLPREHILPVHIEHVLPSDTRDALTSHYDPNAPLRDFAAVAPTTSNQPSSTTTTDMPKEIPFENVVITDVDANAPSNELRAGAIRHVKKKGGAYIEISHDPKPVNEFCNPELFPMIYPTLFPYGIGGFENFRREATISFKRQVKH
ncbi:hypothetical protein FPV67DRAFT_1401039, partial [Lyophyllum atratum]